MLRVGRTRVGPDAWIVAGAFSLSRCRSPTRRSTRPCALRVSSRGRRAGRARRSRAQARRSFSEPGRGHAANETSVSAVGGYGVQERDVIASTLVADCTRGLFARGPLAHVVPWYLIDAARWSRWDCYAVTRMRRRGGTPDHPRAGRSRRRGNRAWIRGHYSDGTRSPREGQHRPPSDRGRVQGVVSARCARRATPREYCGNHGEEQHQTGLGLGMRRTSSCATATSFCRRVRRCSSAADWRPSSPASSLPFWHGGTTSGTSTLGPARRGARPTPMRRNFRPGAGPRILGRVAPAPRLHRRDDRCHGVCHAALT